MHSSSSDWWRGGVIYQIYPRSFLDSNGDGIGDLEGIRRKLDYVAELGVDAIWISPFFRSPMKDFGYDVSDYTAVDPMFGDIGDFDRVVAEAHGLGLKVMIDFVASHTSDQHGWFAESREDHDNPKADWYVWADAKLDGTPPNNWLSVFGGSAWQWDTRRCQYYLHNFLASQPDLNYHNPDVVEAILGEVRFWLERGVDGFRLDAINFCFHDATLTDNPAMQGHRQTFIATPENPYAFQHHVYDKSQPEMLPFLRRLRALTDEYGDIALMGEIGDDDARRLMAAYTTGGDKLHMAYTFDLLTERGSAAYIRSVVEGLEAEIGDGYPCWSIGNHDVQRVATRWGKGAPAARVARVYAALLVSLRGGACLYQGDELGLTEAEIAYEDLQDPYGVTMWPRFKGRDGCRTPMPWTHDGVNAGFTEGLPWLPIPLEHREMAVDIASAAEDSTLQACRRFLHWRRDHPALIQGVIRFHESAEGVVLLEREAEGERLIAGFNLSAHASRVRLPAGLRIEPALGHGFAGKLAGETLEIPAYEAFFGHVGFGHVGQRAGTRERGSPECRGRFAKIPQTFGAIETSHGVNLHRGRTTALFQWRSG